MDDGKTPKTGKVNNSGIPGGKNSLIDWCTFRRKGCSSCLRKINAEPIILLSMTGYGMITTIMPLFLYWARCVQIFDNRPDITTNITDFCQHLTKQNSTYQNSVERDISTWRIFLQLGSGLPTLIIAPILGAWADGAGGTVPFLSNSINCICFPLLFPSGRKKPLIICLLGLTIYSGLQIVATLTYKTVPVYPLLLLAELAAGLSGGTMTFFATSFAMVCDASRHQMQQVHIDLTKYSCFIQRPISLKLSNQQSASSALCVLCMRCLLIADC
jgi:MFS family permease